VERGDEEGRSPEGRPELRETWRRPRMPYNKLPDAFQIKQKKYLRGDLGRRTTGRHWTTWTASSSITNTRKFKNTWSPSQPPRVPKTVPNAPSSTPPTPSPPTRNTSRSRPSSASSSRTETSPSTSTRRSPPNSPHLPYGCLTASRWNCSSGGTTPAQSRRCFTFPP
jgi:hypothetical protein